MLTSRVDYNNLAETMTQGLDEVRKKLVQVFNKNTNRNVNYKTYIVETIWSFLIQVPKFTYVKELDTFYENIKTNLDAYIQDASNQFNKQPGLSISDKVPNKLPENFICFLRELVNVIHLLKRHQQFIFIVDDHGHPYQKIFDELIQRCQSFFVETQTINQEEIRSSITVLQEMLFRIISVSNKFGIKKIPCDVVSNKNFKYEPRDKVDLDKFQFELNKLPNYSELIDLKNSLSEEKESATLDFNILTLQSHSRAIYTIKCNLIDILIKYQFKLIKIYQALHEQNQSLSTKFTEVELAYDKIKQLYANEQALTYDQSDLNISGHFQELNAVREKLIDFLKNQNEDWFNIKFLSTKNNDEQPANEINAELLHLINILEQQQSPFLQSTDTMDLLTYHFNTCKLEYDKIKDLMVDLKNVVTPLETTINDLVEIFAKVIENVNVKTQTTTEFLKEFFNENWKGMVVGTAVCAVPGVAGILVSASAAGVFTSAGAVAGCCAGGAASMFRNSNLAEKNKLDKIPKAPPLSPKI